MGTNKRKNKLERKNNANKKWEFKKHGFWTRIDVENQTFS